MATYYAFLETQAENRFNGKEKSTLFIPGLYYDESDEAIVVLQHHYSQQHGRHRSKDIVCIAYSLNLRSACLSADVSPILATGALLSLHYGGFTMVASPWSLHCGGFTRGSLGLP
jgi:hypothetical protein